MKEDDVEAAGIHLQTMAAIGFGEPGQRLATLTMTVRQARMLGKLAEAAEREAMEHEDEDLVSALYMIQRFVEAIEEAIEGSEW